MSHYDEYYEEYYNGLVKHANVAANKKKEDFINKTMRELGLTYQEAEIAYEKDMQNHIKILSSW